VRYATVCGVIPNSKMKEIQSCLLIDDDPDDQEIFLMCIGKISEPVNCITANGGVEAIDMLQSQNEYSPNYIFLDVNMPKMNGIECLKNIKKIDRLKSTNIYMYSTTSEGAVEAESENLGATGFIIKPASISILRDQLEKIFTTG
jgi:CheY-like chemotaxis protein